MPVAYECDGAGALVGCGCGGGRQVRGDQDGLRGVEAGAEQGLERLGVVGPGDPVGVESGPGERARKLDDGTLPVRSNDRRQFLQGAWSGDARFGYDVETERVAEPLQLRVQLPVEFIGGASRTN